MPFVEFHQRTSLMASTWLSTDTSGASEHISLVAVVVARLDAAVAASSEASGVAEHISLEDSSSAALWTPDCFVYDCTLPGTHPDPFAPNLFLCNEHFRQTTEEREEVANDNGQQRHSRYNKCTEQSLRTSGAAEHVCVVVPAQMSTAPAAPAAAAASATSTVPTASAASEATAAPAASAAQAPLKKAPPFPPSTLGSAITTWNAKSTAGCRICPPPGTHSSVLQTSAAVPSASATPAAPATPATPTGEHLFTFWAYIGKLGGGWWGGTYLT